MCNMWQPLQCLIKIICLNCACLPFIAAITMQQFEQSLDMMRNGCSPKFKISSDVHDKMRYGDFTVVNQDTMCYTKCVAQMAGTLTKKGEFSIPKATAQIPIILPPELQETAKAALVHCKDVQKNYKDSCEKVFQVTKCVADFDPPSFKYP